MKRWLFILAIAVVCSAQVTRPSFSGALRPTGSAVPVLVASTCQGLGANGGMTSPIDTTGANFLVASVARYSAVTLTDSKSNTWVPLTLWVNSSEPAERIFYSENPTVGSGHTITLAGTATYAGVCFEAWSGMAIASVFDSGTDLGANPLTATCATGSITPSSGVKLLITGVAFAMSGAAPTVDSSFTRAGQYDFSTGNYEGQGIAHLIQTPNGVAVNPTWTTPGTAACAIAAFKGQ